jgi:hypothetical protein
MKPRQAYSAVISALFSAAAMAGVATTPPTFTTTPGTSSETSRTDTRAYAGLNWTLGGGYTPALVLGVANTKVKSNGNTTGARLAFHLNLAGGIAPGMLKLSYLSGKNDLQGEIGAGYNFLKGAPALSLGLNAPYIAAGLDGYLNPEIVPYVTLHTQGAFSKPKRRVTPGTSVASCPEGYTLTAPDTCTVNVLE